MTDALTPEQITTLRFIADHSLVIEEDSDNFYSADYLNVCGFVKIDNGAWKITREGKIVLATLDANTPSVGVDEVAVLRDDLEKAVGDLTFVEDDYAFGDSRHFFERLNRLRQALRTENEQ